MSDSTNEMDDFWAQMAAAPPPPEASFEQLPVGLYYVGRCATAQNESWRPKVRTVEYDSRRNPGEKVVMRFFEIGLEVVGGEEKVDQRLAGRWQRWDAAVWPGDREDQSHPISGRLTGFLNAVFAGGVASDEKDAAVKTAARWAATMRTLKAVHAMHPEVTLANYRDAAEGVQPRAMGLMLAGLAQMAMDEAGEGALVLFKTSYGKPKEGQKKEDAIVKANAEEFTAASAAKRKVRVWGPEGVTLPAAPPEAAPRMTF